MKLLFFSALVQRRLFASVLVIVLAASAIGPAWAGQGRGGRVRAQAIRPASLPRPGRVERSPAAARAQVALPQPAPQAIPAERPAEPPQVERSGRPGRLTPEERKALRQQINDAGRDIYRAPGP